MRWPTVRVLHFDTLTEDLHLEHPIPLAPWRIWFEGGYQRFRDVDTFRQALSETVVPTAIALHLTDLEKHLRSGELDDWMKNDPHSERPERAIFVYSGTWNSSGNYSNVVPHLSPTEHGKHWITVPKSVLWGPARPIAWWGHRDELVPFATLERLFSRWRQEAAGNIVTASFTSGDEQAEQNFLDRFAADFLHVGLLVHHLDQHTNSRQRDEPTRRDYLLDDADILWLLAGVAQSLDWTRAATFSLGVLKQLELLLRSGISLAQENRSQWQEIIDNIGELRDRVQS